MKTIIKLFVFTIFTGLLISCEQPFKAGLGPKEDIIPPEFKGGILPASGAFLTGMAEFKGVVWDDIAINRVEVYVDGRWAPVSGFDSKTGNWTYNFDTTDREEGPLYLKFRCIDIKEKVTETQKLAYTIKNLPPQVEITIPGIKGDDFDNPNLNIILDEIPVYQGSDLMGVTSDSLGIKEGFPQIMFWPSNYNGIPSETDPKYGWKSLVVPKEKDGLLATQFSWPMVELVNDGSGGWRLPDETEQIYLQPGKYRFKIRTMDMNGVVNTYPNRLDNKLGMDGTPANPENHHNQYMEINYLAAQIPIITIKKIPVYYNGTGDFTVELKVSCNNEISFVRANVTDFEDENQGTGYISPSYEAQRTGVNGSVYDYLLTIPESKAVSWPAVTDGNLFLHLSAVDVNQKPSPPLFRNFIFDKEAPELIFDRPVIGRLKMQGSLGSGAYEIYDSNRWVTGKITVGGISKDMFGVKKLYYHIGKLGDDGINGAVTDVDRETRYAAAPWIDTALDTQTPVLNWSGSVYAWSYTYNFNEYNDSSFSHLFQEGEELEAGYRSTLGTSQFYMPFYVKIMDNAGNQKVTQYKLYIDPDMDYPQTSFTNPGENDEVGGEVRISGTASDNNWVHSVDVRITDLTKLPSDPDYYYKNASDDWAYGPNPADQNNRGWVKAHIVGNNDMVVAWFYNINSDNKLTPTDNKLTPVKIESRAIDAKIISPVMIPDLTGLSAALDIKFSAGVPTISTPQIIKTGSANRDFYEGIRTSGIYRISTTIRDDGGITAVKVRFTGQSSFTDLIKNSVVQSPAWMIQYPYITDWSISVPVFNSVNQRWESSLNIEIDTTKITNPNLGYGKTGNFTLELQVEDNNDIPGPYKANGTYTMGIDNFYPETEIMTQYSAATENFYVMGTAKDYDSQSGGIQGLERVLVYFEKDGNFYNARGKKPGDSDSFYSGGAGSQYSGEWSTIPAMTSYPNVKDMTQTPNPVNGHAPNVVNFSNFPLLKLRDKGNTGEVWESPHAIVIDSQELGANVDTDGDGTFAEQWEGRVDKDWMAKLDTTSLPDGPLTVHYIVMDQAGNATHYTEDIYIGNNRPFIRFINLGTDINGNGSVAPWLNSGNPGEHQTYPWTVGENAENNREITSGFRIRNSYFNIMLDTLYGNGQKHYRVNYVTRNAVPINSTAMTAGKVYTVKDPGNTRWERYGAPGSSAGTSYADVTFVASGPARPTTGLGSATTGTVWEYTYATGPGTEISGTFPGDTQNTILFNNFANIADSTKILDANNDLILQSDRRFIIKIYDTTVPAGSEEKQLAHVALINVDIDNDDEISPYIIVNPFHWNNMNDNSLYQNSKDNGHIELEADLPAIFNTANGLMDRDPKVSGKISIRGTAKDNNSIGAIYFKIDGFTDSGATQGTGTAAGYYRAAVLSGDDLSGTDRFNSNGWKFTVDKTTERHDQDGHYLEWQLDFDSRFINGVTAVDRGISVIAKDIRSTTGNFSNASTIQTMQGSLTSYYRMDIVPYISGISTTVKTEGGLKNNNIRSADGKYSVIQGNNSQFITVTGFNLNPISNGVKVQTEDQKNVYNPSSAVLTGTNLMFNSASITAPYTSFTMSNNSNNSGYLTVWGGTSSVPIGSLNNIDNNNSLGSYRLKLSTDNAALGTSYKLLSDISNGSDEENMPNREADRYLTKNITLANDRYLQFFTVKRTDVKNGYYPVMIMKGNNPVFGYIDPKGGPSSIPAAGAGGGAGSSHADDARSQRAEFDYTSANALYKEYLIKNLVADQMAMAVDSAGRYGHYTVYNYSSGSSEYIYDRYAELWGNEGYGWSSGATYVDWPGSTTTGRYRASDNVNTAMSFEAPSYTNSTENAISQLDRYLYPKLIIKGDSINSYAANYLAYFDDGTTDKRLIFRTFQVGIYGSVRVNRLSYSDAQYDNQGRRYDTFTNYSGAYVNGTGRNTAAINASKYFDMGILSDGRVVIVYLDESTGRLRLIYSNDTVDGSVTTGITFTENTSIVLPDYVGMYVSMQIDNSGHIHVAAYNSLESELQYIFIPSYDANTYKTVTVDQFGSVGYWTTIKLNSAGVPYIAYYNAAETGGRESIKLAYAKNPVTGITDVKGGVDSNGCTTGDWEYMTVPTLDPPQGGSPGFQRVNLGFMDSAPYTGAPMLGYLGTNIEFSYPVSE